MEKLLVWKSALAEISPEDFSHPGLRMARFIFCDDQPNDNLQGIEYEDFEEIKKSAIGTPVKIKFFGASAGGHLGSIPIGFIKDMFERQVDGVNQLVADAVLFATEFPDEVEYLETSFAEGKAPGISWEIGYHTSIIREGVEWIKGLVTRAATFVRNPAYGNRTAIIALASNRELTDEQMMVELSELANDNSPKITDEGGNNRMDEKELQELRDKLAALETSLAEKTTEITDLTAKIESLTTTVAEKDSKIAEFERKELVASRTAQIVEAGIELPTDPEKLAAKQAFYADMTEEGFAEYKEDLTSNIEKAVEKAGKKKEGFSSLRTPERLPRFTASSESDDDDEEVTLVGMKAKFGQISRSYASSESE